MAKKAKLLAKLRNNPTNVSFEELDTLLRSYGFECRRPSGGSHYVYKRGDDKLSVPRHKPIKTVYVKKAVTLIEKYEDEVDEAEE
jgi:predicted RNA binding protein YcfA (HicA-like mRNA interferase family)